MKKSLFLLHIAVFLASLTAIFGKLINLDAVLLTWYRMVFAWILLVVLDWGYKYFTTQKVEPSYIWVLDRIKIMGIGLLLGLHWIFFYGSIKYANISVGVVCFCLTGFFTAILGPLIHRTNIAWKDVGISLITLIGIGLIFKFETSFRLGILLGVVSSIFVALFTVLNEPWTKHVEATRLTKYHMLGGSVGIGLLLPVYLRFNPLTYILPQGLDVGYLILLASVCTVLLYVLLNKALIHISAFTVNMSFNLEPLYAIALAALFFDEFKEVNTLFFVGLGLIFLSLLLQLKTLFNSTQPKGIGGAKADL